MKKIDLCGEWIGKKTDGSTFIGIVPGCVHTDLFDLPKLFLNQNAEESLFIENEDWIYSKKFHVNKLYSGAVLTFQGLDTYCDIYLNGTKIGFSDNMFIPHSFNVDGTLREGENTLEVKFFSPVKYVSKKENLPGAFTTERLHTRRIQCTYGWDWVARFVTCGIFRPVYIEFINQMQVKHVYVYTDIIDSHGAQLNIYETFFNYNNGGNVTTQVFDEDGNLTAQKSFFCDYETQKLIFNISNPKLWYPSGYGKQPLYTLKITIGEQEFLQKFGIRTARIIEKKDEPGSSNEKLCKALQKTDSGTKYDFNTSFSGFIPIINDTEIFCIGANWVPCEPFPSAETSQKITEILEMAKSSGINMIRVWGGGLFEKEHFYNECDRLGILVTQDFLMACGEYPEHESGFLSQLKKEARFAAIYLRNHPSLVWWTGDNENAILGNDLKKEYHGRIASRHAIAPVLRQFDSNRPFLESSPYGGDMYASKTRGTTHNTQFLDDLTNYILDSDFSDYKEYWKAYTARFIAEEPIMGAVSKNSLKKFISGENIENRDLWLYHTKTNPGLKVHLLEMVENFSEKLFGKFTDFEDKYFKLRYLQYEWVRITLENAMRNLDFCSGIVYWMLNDCWPAAVGWSLIDYYNTPKSGYYAIKHHGTSLSICFDKQDSGIYLCISNILPDSVECSVKVILFDLPASSKQNILNMKLTAHHGNEKIKINKNIPKTSVYIAEITSGGTGTRSFYTSEKVPLKKEDKINVIFEKGSAKISAPTYVHSVEIANAENISDNYFSLLPGETKTIFYNDKGISPTITAYTLDL